MNVILEVTKDVAQYVGVQEYQMLTTAKNVHKWKKIEMDAQKL